MPATVNSLFPGFLDSKLSRYYDELVPPDQDGLFGRYSVLGEDSLYFLIPAFTALGIIYLLPEEVSNWDKDDISLPD